MTLLDLQRAGSPGIRLLEDPTSPSEGPIMRLSEGPAYEALSDSTTLTKGQSGPQMALLDSQRALPAPKGPIRLSDGTIRLSKDSANPPEGSIRLSEGPMRLSEEPISHIRLSDFRGSYQPSRGPY